jgi:hypothetical protein
MVNRSYDFLVNAKLKLAVEKCRQCGVFGDSAAVNQALTMTRVARAQ